MYQALLPGNFRLASHQDMFIKFSERRSENTRALGVSYPHEFKHFGQQNLVVWHCIPKCLNRSFQKQTILWDGVWGTKLFQGVQSCLCQNVELIFQDFLSVQCKGPQLVHKKARRRPIVEERSWRWKPLDPDQVFVTLIDPFLLCSRWHTEVWCKREVVPSAQKWSRSAHHRDSSDLGPSTSQ